MWCDWSISATVLLQARCSSRQFVNSGAIGNVNAGQYWLRSSSTGLPDAGDRLGEGLGERCLWGTGICCHRDPH